MEITLRLFAAVAAFSAPPLFVAPAEAASFRQCRYCRPPRTARRCASQFPGRCTGAVRSVGRFGRCRLDLKNHLLVDLGRFSHGVAPANYVIEKLDLDVGANNQARLAVDQADRRLAGRDPSALTSRSTAWLRIRCRSAFPEGWHAGGAAAKVDSALRAALQDQARARRGYLGANPGAKCRFALRPDC